MKRRGLITLCVLTCLAVTLSLVMMLMQAALRARRDVAVRLQVQQTDWLLDAGIQLANARLAESNDYEGETWQLGDAVAGYYAAKVLITVNRDDASVEVVAQLSNSNMRGDRASGLVTQRSNKQFQPRSGDRL